MYIPALQNAVYIYFVEMENYRTIGFCVSLYIYYIYIKKKAKLKLHEITRT